MLSRNMTYPVILRFIEESKEPGQVERYADKALLSRHRSRCLMMAPKTVRTVQPVEIDTPPLEAVLDETLKILYTRLKTEPEKVKTSEAIQLMGHAIRRLEIGAKKSDTGARLAQINDGSKAEQNQA
jgi:hypothetical protein